MRIKQLCNHKVWHCAMRLSVCANISTFEKRASKMVPVVIGTLGLIKKGLEKHVEKIPGAININDLQRIISLGVANVLNKVPLKSNSQYPFFTFSYTISLSERSCQISSYYEHQNSRFLDLYFREFTAAINFPCSKSWLRIGVNNNWYCNSQNNKKTLLLYSCNFLH